VIEAGLHAISRLLSWMPDGARVASALPLLVLLLIVLVNGVLRWASAIDRLVRPLVSGLASMVGLLALLPEYLLTTALRRLGQRPPNAFYLYGEAVENAVLLTRQVARAGLASLTDDKRLRRVLVVLIVGAMVSVGNARSCPANAGSTCKPPVASWWTHITRSGDEPQTVQTPPAKR